MPGLCPATEQHQSDASPAAPSLGRVCTPKTTRAVTAADLPPSKRSAVPLDGPSPVSSPGGSHAEWPVMPNRVVMGGWVMLVGSA